MGYRNWIGLLGLLVMVLVLGTACGDTAATEAADTADTVVEGQLVESADALQPEAADEMADDMSGDDRAETEETAADSTGAEADASASTGTTFTIVPEESEARFQVQEVLTGVDTTVIGATNSVEGTITVNTEDPSASSVNTIRVDLSTLQTDNNFRNRAIHDRILETGNPDFQHAAFVGTGVSGLPDTIAVGDTVDFQVTGNLTLHGVTQEVTFDTTATLVSEDRLEGLASLPILYSDYGVQIIQLPPQVASVEDQVILELEFVATSM